MANEIYIAAPTSTDDYFYEDGTGSNNGEFEIGNNDSQGWGNMKGAIRFDAVNVDRGGCNYAGLYLWTSRNGKSLEDRDGNWSFRVYAVDEDDTGDFSSNPFGRTHTTNYNTSSNSDEPDIEEYKEITVTSCVNEVMSRANWKSGNSIVLLLQDIDSGCANKYVIDNDKNSFLLIRKAAEPTWNTTPKNVAAPTFPSADSYGLKISYPGYDVKTATENQLYYTTRKRSHKIVSEGVINTTANVTYNKAHGLGYIPFCTAYAKETGSTKRYKIPRYLPISIFQGQFASLDTTNGTVEVDATNIKITTTSACEVYYRIFLDQIS